MKILIIGCNGMLAQDLKKVLQNNNIEQFGVDIPECDITSPDSVKAILEQQQPTVVINCAAYTAVDKAESEQDAAYSVNVTGAEVLARLSVEYNYKLVHISTDFVFSGEQSTPYTEDAAASPLGVYGQTKYEGEQKIQEFAKDCLIVRTAWLYGANGNNFVKTMLDLASRHPELKVIADQIGSPTWTTDLSNALVKLLQKQAQGLFHFSNSGQCSWHGFAEQIIANGQEMGLLEKTVPVKPIPTSEYPTPAKRPAFSLLNKAKYISLTGEVPPDWQDSLKEMMKEL
jgi:dTDP-4-dehydrorhamnose reductase